MANLHSFVGTGQGRLRLKHLYYAGCGDFCDRLVESPQYPATVVGAQSQLPMAHFWAAGTTASSDGQFFPATRQGETMNLINAKYGHEPGLKAYSHLSDQFAPFATQTIPSTVSEAPYILDGLLMNETGRHIREQYADTGGVPVK